MELLEIIRKRSSIRAFQNREVEEELLRSVLDAARWAPSGTNTQPWSVAVVSGDSKRELCDKLTSAFREEEPSNMDYQYYPKTFEEPYKSRRFTCGKALYQALDIKRGDREKRKAQWEKNYQGFGAPVELFVFIDQSLEKGSWVDMGMFIQNVMLAAEAVGLATCAQAAMAEYPHIVREFLDLPDSLSLICGIAIGYADKENVVNQYRTERESVDEFTSWHR